jgi:hypothetical protein
LLKVCRGARGQGCFISESWRMMRARTHVQGPRMATVGNSFNLLSQNSSAGRGRRPSAPLGPPGPGRTGHSRDGRRRAVGPAEAAGASSQSCCPSPLPLPPPLPLSEPAPLRSREPRRATRPPELRASRWGGSEAGFGDGWQQAPSRLPRSQLHRSAPGVAPGVAPTRIAIHVPAAPAPPAANTASLLPILQLTASLLLRGWLAATPSRSAAQGGGAGPVTVSGAACPSGTPRRARARRRRAPGTLRKPP